MPEFGQEIKWWEMPSQEAVDYFLGKTPMTQTEFAALRAEMRAKAFTVAYVSEANLVQEVYDACLSAITAGTTLAEFTRATEHIFTQPWHQETVFRTNVLSAYGGGHWQQAQATKDTRPYVIYRDCGDGRVRAWHRLGGLVLPLDHPFVHSHWCPWEWN